LPRARIRSLKHPFTDLNSDNFSSIILLEFLFIGGFEPKSVITKNFNAPLQNPHSITAKSMSRKPIPKRTTRQAAGTIPWLEKALRNIPDYISDSIYCLDSNGNFIFVNNSITERSGIAREKLIGSHFLHIIEPEYHRLAGENFERVMNGNDGIPYELSYKRPDGQLHIIEVHSKPIRHGGKIVGLLGIARNITERKLAEQALRISEINLSRLVKEKTAEFLARNMEMAMEIKEHKRTESALRKRIRELKAALSIHSQTAEVSASSGKGRASKPS
jgi:PAS domain S-box-containing protein